MHLFETARLSGLCAHHAHKVAHHKKFILAHRHYSNQLLCSCCWNFSCNCCFIAAMVVGLVRQHPPKTMRGGEKEAYNSLHVWWTVSTASIICCANSWGWVQPVPFFQSAASASHSSPLLGYHTKARRRTRPTCFWGVGSMTECRTNLANRGLTIERERERERERENKRIATKTSTQMLESKCASVCACV